MQNIALNASHSQDTNTAAASAATAPGGKVTTYDPPPRPKTISLAEIEKALLTENQLDALTIPERRRLLGDWFYEGDLGFVFAPRGVGKTWVGLAMARALADGATLGPWSAGDAARVLYVDGEMHLGVMRQRNQFLRNSAGENLFFISHQQVFDLLQNNLGLSDREQQAAITALCVKLGVKVLFLDNLSTLFTGVKENEADGWRDMVEGWLLELRRNRIAVVIIAHAGRNGLTSCSDIAEEMNLTKGQVSKLAAKAEREGWLTKRGREYSIVEGK